jgi:2,4-dienoyl-CoA reductase-like NADH-dependent reductase (Old Yellow Enzyme family)/NADPH-dependent 2,4-dienoyl-CoA reductase/sulfur reductase-like enzyme
MYNKILQKGNIGKLELDNRLVMAPMGSHYGNVSEDAIAYYAARAHGGFGLLITEFTCIDQVGKAQHDQLMIDSDDYIPEFKKLTERIHEEGGKIFMQLQHSGRQTTHFVTGMQPVAPSPIPCPMVHEMPRELTAEEIYEIIEKFGDSALRAKKAGFDGVDISGGHGYLVAQFLSSYSNKRSDEFGGDITGRAKFAVELIENIKKKCGKDFPLTFRISGDERVEGGRKAMESAIIAKILEEAGADAISVTAGVYGSMQYVIPPANVPNGYNLSDSEVIKKSVNIPVIVVGRINDPVMVEYVLAKGIADFVALGRASLADPEFPNKVKENRTEEISPCVGCMTRCVGAPGVDPEDKGISCMLNPFSGHELTMKITKTDKPKNIVVVGGGPGGLEAAWVSAARGHKVTLFEKNNKLGGQVVPGSVPPAKHELARAIKYYVTMCKKYGVDIKLGAEADVEKIISSNADEVILATGSTPIVPKIENDGIPTFQAIDVLLGNVTSGRNSLVVGGGLVGLETAEYLLAQGSKATVVEMKDKAGEGVNQITQYFIFKNLKEGGVDVLTNTKVEKFTKEGAICTGPSGEVNLSGYDMVILALGARAYNPLEESLKGKVKSLHLIGDTLRTRRIVDAVEEAARLAIIL